MRPARLTLPRPAPGEYDPASSGYIAAAPSLDDALTQMTIQRDSVRQRLSGVLPSKAGFRYAEGKWTVREVVGHVSDAERVFAYRLLRIGRGDATPLAGFDENAFVPAAGSDARTMGDLVEEWVAVRNATLALVGGMPAEAWTRRGTANGQSVTTAALAYIIYGHVEHHVRILTARYGI
jgi:hypothetical protein